MAAIEQRAGCRSNKMAAQQDDSVKSVSGQQVTARKLLPAHYSRTGKSLSKPKGPDVPKVQHLASFLTTTILGLLAAA